jgi:hypothetical protein
VSIATEPPEVGSLAKEQELLRARLARSRLAIRLEMGLEFVLDAVFLLVLAAAVLVALDFLAKPGLGGRRVLLAIAVVGVVAGLVIRSIPRLRAWRLDDLALAMTLDRYRPGTGQQVADILQLPGLLDEPGGTTSPTMVRMAVRRASDSLAGVDWRAHWNGGRTAARLAGLVVVLAVPVIFALASPRVASLSVARWLRGSTERWPQATYLSVVGLGAKTALLAPRDEPFTVEVRSDLPEASPTTGGWKLAGRGEPLTIRIKPDSPVAPESVRVIETTADGTTRGALMTATGPARFRHEFPPSSASTSFDLTGGDDWLGPIRVERVDRPAPESIRLRVREPGSSEGSFRPVADIRQYPTFLADTEVELTVVGTEPIAKARIEVHPGTPPEIVRNDSKTFVARWILREATTLEIQLTSETTGLTSKPSFLSIGLLKDREPRVTLRPQGIGSHVTPVATVPLVLAATDDFGIASLRLLVERTTHGDEKSEPVTVKQTIPMPLATDGGRAVLDHQARHDLELRVSQPAIGALIRLQAEAEDKSVRGAQVGRSGVIQLQVVSPDELFYEILIRQRAERAKFIAACDAADKLGSSLAGTPRPDDYANVARSMHTIARQLDQIAAKIADSLQEMKLNEVGSPKSHRLLQEGVVDPIRALIAGRSGELRTHLQSLASGAKVTTAESEKAREMHREVVARMKAILDQMSQWESFVDVVNQVAEVIKIQQKVLQATEKARESRTQEVFDEKP